jgi:cytochrome c2
VNEFEVIVNRKRGTAATLSLPRRARRLLLLLVIALVALGCGRKSAFALGGDPSHGKQLIEEKYGCPACHSVPGVEGPRGMVGPPLDHIAIRQFLIGKLENTPQNMSKWLQNPQGFAPGNAMPNLGVTPDDARDITAYLFTLK